MNALDIISEFRVDGSIATIKTMDRGEVILNYPSFEEGMRGKPLTSRCTHLIRMISDYTGGNLQIIGIGGIMGTSDTQAKLDAGASLV